MDLSHSPYQHLAFLGPLLVTSRGRDVVRLWGLEGGQHLCDLKRRDLTSQQMMRVQLVEIKTSPHDGGIVYAKFNDGKVVAWRAEGAAARTRWRRAAGIVHALLSARNRAAERLYAFGGPGYETSRAHFEGLLLS